MRDRREALSHVEGKADRNMIIRLARNDFRTKFAGAYLGIVWAFVQPVVTVFIYWFVFQKALHAGTQAARSGIAVPYVLWLVAGLVPWFYFSEAVTSGTRVLTDYSFLVKKVVFRIDILPIVRILSSLYVHVFFIVIMLILYTALKLYPTIYAVQIIYYSFGMIMLCLGLTYLFSAIAVFFRDLNQIVNIAVQVGIWFTPIMWNINAMDFSRALKLILKVNPMFYIVQGYRDALVDHLWFWERPWETLYFWVLVVVIYIIGVHVFNKLRPHYADAI